MKYGGLPSSLPLIPTTYLGYFSRKPPFFSIGFYTFLFNSMEASSRILISLIEVIDGPHVYTYIIFLFSVSFTRIKRCFTRPTKCCKGLYYGGLYVRIGRSQPRRQGPAFRDRLHYRTCVPRPRIPI